MFEWWQNLSTLARWFYGAAAFFSVFFLWQFISSLIGLGGSEEIDVDADADMDMDMDADAGDLEAGSAGDAVETVAAFKMLSIRSILAFFTMFFWAGALYLSHRVEPTRAIGYGIAWGAGGFLAVALVVNLMRRMAETGSAKLASCLGRQGTVYLNIPADGEGEVRVTVGNAVTYVKARSAGGSRLAPGTPIRVLRTLGPNTIEVEPIDEDQSGKGQAK